MYHGNERPFVEILQNGGWSAVVSIEKAASCVYCMTVDRGKHTKY